ncbi:uncharacterized protein C8A04DRAFT_29369 [Dichotomopilus funicola]|uniref:RRM domain-containing protein n=1 Tax=Dichotomopilus funicola TaxID=1934379 RepID=A0AAN6V1Y5_9PEZI|nr:hypothetical protein C8A04DRAFT_29369 [Dichotomopilus funicola]
MSGKLDQTLDEILTTQRRNQQGRRRSTRRTAGSTTRAAPTAPAGGVQKSTKATRGANKPTPAKGAGQTGESKIMVSNLPRDVSEAQIKEYFSQSVGQVKKVEIAYGPGGQSRGNAHVTFQHADGASKAFASLNGLLIDNKPVKVEVVVASADLIPQPKTLAQRMTQPKAQPKSAANVKKGANATGKGAAGKGTKKAGRPRPNRPAKKTAEELDSEMADYFDTANTENNAATATAPAAAATGGDAAMEEDVL